jgi:hypothetical protein
VAGPCEHGNEPLVSKRCKELAEELLASQEGNLLHGVSWLFSEIIAMDFVCNGRSWSCKVLPVSWLMYSIFQVSPSSLDKLHPSVTTTILNWEGPRLSHRQIVPYFYQQIVLENSMNLYYEFCLP